MTEVTGPGPAASEDQPVVGDHQPGERTGLDTQLVNTTELPLHVRRHLPPVPGPGVGPEGGDEGMSCPGVEGPEPSQGEGQEGQQHRGGQKGEEEGADLQQVQHGVVVPVHGGEIAVPEEVTEGEERVEDETADSPLHVVTEEVYLLAADPVIVC